jgi:hypothetical protein
LRARLLAEIEPAVLAAADGFQREAAVRIQHLRPRLDGCVSASGTPDSDGWPVDSAIQVRMRREINSARHRLAP